MHSAIRATGPHYGAAFLGNLFKHSFQLTLNGRSRVLQLPPVERGAVILDDQAVPLELLGDHGGKGRREAADVKPDKIWGGRAPS